MVALKCAPHRSCYKSQLSRVKEDSKMNTKIEKDNEKYFISSLASFHHYSSRVNVVAWYQEGIPGAVRCYDEHRNSSWCRYEGRGAIVYSIHQSRILKTLISLISMFFSRGRIHWHRGNVFLFIPLLPPRPAPSREDYSKHLHIRRTFHLRIPHHTSSRSPTPISSQKLHDFVVVKSELEKEQSTSKGSNSRLEE